MENDAYVPEPGDTEWCDIHRILFKEVSFKVI